MEEHEIRFFLERSLPKCLRISMFMELKVKHFKEEAFILKNFPASMSRKENKLLCIAFLAQMCLYSKLSGLSYS